MYPVRKWDGEPAKAARQQVWLDGMLNNKPCNICHEPIDYSLSYPHPMSLSVEHVKPRRLFPELTWDPANWRPAHSRCNKQGKRSGTRADYEDEISLEEYESMEWPDLDE